MKLYVLLLATWTSFSVFDCYVCGGITAPGTQGLLPGNAYHYIGFSQSYSRFYSTHPGQLNGEDLYTNEHFLRSNLAARRQFSSRLNSIVEIPVSYNLQTSEHETSYKTGLGDIKCSFNQIAIKKNRKRRIKTSSSNMELE